MPQETDSLQPESSDNGILFTNEPLTSDRIEAVLDSFRHWLGSLLTPPDAPPASAAPFDLHTLTSQFTALRHDVNLQTRAARIASEQSNEAIRLLNESARQDADALVRPLLKAIVEIADTIALAHRQVTKTIAAAEPLLDTLGTSDASAPPPPLTPPAAKPGFFARLFGARDTTSDPIPAASNVPDDAKPADNERKAAATKVGSLIMSVADGYAMSLRRVERVLAANNILPIATVGLPYDAETMEVVEVISGSQHPANTVVEEVSRGFRWKDSVFRCAQVKVAR